MIKNFLITGDKHGDFNFLNNIIGKYPREETAIIILGDFSINFWLNKTDQKKKEFVEAQKYYIYAVRGNHEMRPEHLPSLIHEYDKNVGNWVMYEPDYPHIRYFDEICNSIYTINGYRCLVINGAYSVDKYYRLARANMTEETNNPKITGWFADECLTKEEMEDIEKEIEESGNNVFDFVFSHTCPLKYQPTDLFLGFVDQSTVDNSMEVWMDKLSEKIVVNIAWLYGHYHKDRLERPHVEQFFNDIETLDTIAERWKKYDETGELDWWLVKGGLFYSD